MKPKRVQIISDGALIVRLDINGYEFSHIFDDCQATGKETGLIRKWAQDTFGITQWTQMRDVYGGIIGFEAVL